MRLTFRACALGAALALVAAAPVRADDRSALENAIKLHTDKKFNEAALAFFEIAENSGEPELAYRAEYMLALTLFKMGLNHSALTYDNLIIEQGPKHPYYQKALENLLDIMDAVGDKMIVPSVLNKEYNDTFDKLPGPVISRINFIVALWTDQQNNRDESAEFLSAVPKDSAWFPRARYLQGVQMSRDANKQAGAGNQTASDKLYAQAATIYEEILKLESNEKKAYRDLADIQELATLALGRVRYAEGKYGDAYEVYARIPRFSRHWRDALFEGAYAAFQNDESGKALGFLHTLHAPMAGDQLVPESWLLKSYIYYYNCLYDETKAALGFMQGSYPEVAKQVNALIEAKREKEFYYALLAEGKTAGVTLPAMVRNELLTNERLRTRRAYIKALGEEAEVIKGIEEWKKSPVRQYFIEQVEQQRNVIIQVAGAAVLQQLKQIEFDLEDYDGRADILRLEMAKKEVSILESGFDAEKELARQSLERPAMPKKGVEYWDFEGEFWPDELGFYRYTIKNACTPDERAAQSGTTASAQ